MQDNIVRKWQLFRAVYCQNKQDVFEKISVIALIAIYVNFIWFNYHSFMEEPDFSVFLFTVFETIVIAILIIRRPYKHISQLNSDIIYAFIGTFLPLFLRPVSSEQDLIFLQILQTMGVCISVCGILALNQSFGVIAADRGIRQTWIFRFIRHPMYCGYFFSTTTYLLQNLNINNAAIWTIWFIAQIKRIEAEEKILKLNKEYEIYMKNVRWRIIPYIW